MSSTAMRLDAVESLQRYVDDPILDPRLTVRREGRRYVADADLRFRGRVLAAHAAGPTADAAAEAVVKRLRRQLRRIVGADVAQRNEPRTIERALRPERSHKPPEEREIVRRRPYLVVPLSTVDAIDELLDLDVEFLLFTHVRTGEAVVVYRRGDGRLGLIFPAGSVLADEDDLVVPVPDRHGQPVALAEVREEMDLAEQRCVYFVDAADGRGKVLYLRHDGDYGLVQAV
jgi:hypothetical protein